MTTNADPTIPCDIVLLPDDALSATALQCSQLLAGQGALFTLDNEHFYAHASLYQFQMGIANLAKCTDVLKKLAEAYSAQELTQAGYYYQDSGGGKGYFDIALSRNPDVDHLQQAVLDAINPLRAGMRDSDKAKMAEATGAKLENLQKYGYPSAGESFRPHITLTRFPLETEPDTSPLPLPAVFVGKFTKIGLFEMGSNGTCIRKIAAFDL